MGKYVHQPKKPIQHPKTPKPKKGWKFNNEVKRKQKNGGFYRPGK